MKQKQKKKENSHCEREKEKKKRENLSGRTRRNQEERASDAIKLSNL